MFLFARRMKQRRAAALNEAHIRWWESLEIDRAGAHDGSRILFGEDGAGPTSRELTIDVLSDEQLAEIDSAWFTLDADRSGYLDRREMRRVLKYLGIPRTRHIREYLRAMDSSQNGKVEYEDFKLFMARMMCGDQGARELEMAFEMLDVDRDGEISTEVLRYLMVTAGSSPLSEEEVTEFLRMCDPRGTGLVSVERFRSLPCWRTEELLQDSKLSRVTCSSDAELAESSRYDANESMGSHGHGFHLPSAGAMGSAVRRLVPLNFGHHHHAEMDTSVGPSEDNGSFDSFRANVTLGDMVAETSNTAHEAEASHATWSEASVDGSHLSHQSSVSSELKDAPPARQASSGLMQGFRGGATSLRAVAAGIMAGRRLERSREAHSCGAIGGSDVSDSSDEACVQTLARVNRNSCNGGTSSAAGAQAPAHAEEHDYV